MIKIKYLRKFVKISVFFSSLIITPYVSADFIAGMEGMSGMISMEGMVAMYGMDSMTGARSVSYGFVAGNILGSRGWYERRESGQLILYPTTNLYNGMYGINTSMMGMGMNYSNSMSGMSGMTSMLGGMSPTGSVSSISMVSSNTGKINGSSQGWYWIALTGQLVLTPVYNMYGTMEKTDVDEADSHLDAVETIDDNLKKETKSKEK